MITESSRRTGQNTFWKEKKKNEKKTPLFFLSLGGSCVQHLLATSVEMREMNSVVDYRC
jgi:hypothetical protein